MTYYHIIIQQERRTQPERMAQAISSTVQQGDEYVAGPVMRHIMASRGEIYAGRIKTAIANGDEAEALLLQEQAAMGITPDFSDQQYVMVAEWNLSDPHVVVHKGDYAARNLQFGGWPSITREEWDKCDSY